MTNSFGSPLEPELAIALGELSEWRATLDPAVLQTILQAWRFFDKSGSWPAYPSIEKAVIRALPPGTDIWKSLRQAPKWAGWLGQPGHPGTLSVRLLAIAVCVGEEAMALFVEFWQAFILARHIYLNTPDDQKAELTSRLLGQSGLPNALGLSDLDVRKVWALLDSEALFYGGTMTDNPQKYEWEFQIGNRIHDFRDVPSIADYLRLRRVQEMPPLLSDQKGINTSQVSNGAVQPDPRKVFVIHGRDTEAQNALFSFLRDLDLHPLEWEELVSRTKQGSPYTGDVISRAFDEAQAVVALLTPDDEVRLHPSLWRDDEPTEEREFRGQPRPNVYFEAGQAFHAQPDRTILIEIGRIRLASDLHGRNVIRFSDPAKAILALYQRLETAGCAVSNSNPAWMDTKRFELLAANSRHKQITASEPSGAGPESATSTSLPLVNLRATHMPSGVILEVTNNGPSDEFRAEVTDIKGTDDSSGMTPWPIRWRDTPEPDRRLVRGQTAVLNLVQFDHEAAKTLLEGHYTTAPLVFQRSVETGVVGLRAGLNASDLLEWNRMRFCVTIRVFRIQDEQHWDFGIRFGWSEEAQVVDPDSCEPVAAR